ncbi:MAG: hypothetical protein QOJ97_2781 [Solirubrobacteraceae bacterium]|jgi:hypothetical protein|nr:hypothetical protein [Solirubrobacteraceae bacterium]
MAIVAWIVLPAVVYAISLGLAFLLERIARFRIADALLFPLGLALAVVLVAPFYQLESGSWPAAIALVVVSLAGLVVGRGELRRRANPGWIGAAGLVAYLLYMAPVLVSGAVSWTGYNFVNDTAVQFVLVDWLQDHGPTYEALSQGITNVTLLTYLPSGYPLGSHELLATLDTIVRVPVEAAYQPFIAILGAAAATSFASLAWRAGLPRAGAAATGALAAGSLLTYSYALQGNLKEIAMMAMLAVAAAVGREALTGERTIGLAAAAGLSLAACVLVYSAAGAPYAGVLALGILVGALVQRGATADRRRLLVAGAVGAALALVAIVPVLDTIVRFKNVAQGALSSTQAAGTASLLGQLQRPLELVQTAGVWLSGNYLLPIHGRLGDLNDLAIYAVIALGAVGLVWLLARRELGPLLYLVPAAVTLVVVAPRVAPYADAKMLAILSPGIVLVAACGLRAAGSLPLRAAPVVALGVGVLLAGAVVVSDARLYHQVKVSPTERLTELETIGDRYAGQGQVLVNEFEEFAKYFARRSETFVSTDNLSPAKIERRYATEDFFGRYYDLDVGHLEWVERYPYVVQRRSPAASRPPANYRLDYATDHYLVWARRPAPEVLDHLPLQRAYAAAAVPSCSDVRALARTAGPRGRLVAARGPDAVAFFPAFAPRPSSWRKGVFPGTVVPATPGAARGTVEVPAAGEYLVWLEGSFGRRMQVYVDGRDVGGSGRADTPRQWSRVATLRLTAGRHRVEVRRPGQGLGPSDGAESLLGPLVLERAGSRGLFSVRPAQAARLCGRPWDWIDAVRG